MTRIDPAQRSTAAGATAAVLLGAIIGLVQVAVFLGFLGARRPDTSQGADRGFGSNPNLAVEVGWLFGLLVISVVLVAIALAVLRIRWYGLVLPLVLAVEFLLGGWLGTGLPGHSDGRSLVLVAILAAELLLCRLVLPRRA
jgi:hypothetical protein